MLILVGCKDDNEILNDTLRGLQLDVRKLDSINCESFKESKIWSGESWIDYCKSIFSDTFKNNIANFPCIQTCGFCNGKISFWNQFTS